MPDNAIAENVLGTVGTILWSIQLIPQIVKSYRDKSTEGLSPWLMLIWSISAIWLGIYVIVQDLNIPLILQPQLFGTLAAVSWVQCLYYGSKRPLKTCIIILAVYLCTFAGLELGMTYLVRVALRKGNHLPLRFFGIFCPVLIAVALIPQYYEIACRREVIGISLLFISVDISGGVFSILSLVFKPHFDVLAALTYVFVVVLDGVIVIAYLILNPIAARKRREQASSDGDGLTGGSRTGLGMDAGDTISTMDCSIVRSGEVQVRDIEVGGCTLMSRV